MVMDLRTKAYDNAFRVPDPGLKANYSRECKLPT